MCARTGSVSYTHLTLPTGRTAVASVSSRDTTLVAGRVRGVRVQPWGGAPSLECTLADETGSVTLVFLGRRQVAGIRTGTIMSAQGTAATHHGQLAIINPVYEIISTPTMPDNPGDHH